MTSCTSTRNPSLPKLSPTQERSVAPLFTRILSNIQVTTFYALLLLLSICFQRTSDGFDSVPLKSSSSHQLREEDDSDDA